MLLSRRTTTFGVRKEGARLDLAGAVWQPSGVADRNPSFFGSVVARTAAAASAFSNEELGKIQRRRREDDERRADLDLAPAKGRCEPVLLLGDRSSETSGFVVVRVRASDEICAPETVEIVSVTRAGTRGTPPSV